MSERDLSAHEKRFVLPPHVRLALLEDLHPTKCWDSFPVEDWGEFAAPTDLELLNTAIVTGGRVGTQGDVYAGLLDRFRRERMPAFEGRCAICRLPAEDVQIDHIWPVSRYPELVVSLENLAPTCRRCNMAKSTRDPSTDEIAYVEAVTGVEVASPIDWKYRPDPPLRSTFIRGIDV